MRSMDQKAVQTTTNIKRVPSQTVPFPVNPCTHVQTKNPSILRQSAFLSQGFAEHSSMSKVKKLIKKDQEHFVTYGVCR